MPGRKVENWRNGEIHLRWNKGGDKKKEGNQTIRVEIFN